VISLDGDEVRLCPASPDKVVTDSDHKKVVQRTSCYPTSHHASGHADDEGKDDGQVHS
jgi:hypothetical protein